MLIGWTRLLSKTGRNFKWGTRSSEIYYSVNNTTEYAKGEYAGIGGQWIRGKRTQSLQNSVSVKKMPAEIKIREQHKESHSVLCVK